MSKQDNLKLKVKFRIDIQMIKSLVSEVWKEELSFMRNLIKWLKKKNNKMMTRKISIYLNQPMLKTVAVYVTKHPELETKYGMSGGKH